MYNLFSKIRYKFKSFKYIYVEFTVCVHFYIIWLKKIYFTGNSMLGTLMWLIASSCCGKKIPVKKKASVPKIDMLKV